MENLVCITLVRQQKEVFYHKGTYECDFLVKESRKITQAIQVSLSLQEENVRKREVRGLLEAMNQMLERRLEKTSKPNNHFVLVAVKSPVHQLTVFNSPGAGMPSLLNPPGHRGSGALHEHLLSGL